MAACDGNAPTLSVCVGLGKGLGEMEGDVAILPKCDGDALGLDEGETALDSLVVCVVVAIPA